MTQLRDGKNKNPETMSPLKPPPPPLPQSPLRQPPPLRPLQRHRAALQLSMTLSALLSLPSVWPNLKNASAVSKCGTLARLADLSAAHSDLAPYLTREMLLRARAFMSGVSLYREHPVRRGPETAEVIWKSGSTSLRDYAPMMRAAPTVLVIPSLINRFTILDIDPDYSFLRFLAAQGFRPLVVDWDVPSEEEKDFGLDNYIRDRLMPALLRASADGPAYVLGYCMGGTLALALAALAPERVRGLGFLATPWDFHAGYEAMGQDGGGLESRLGSWLQGNDPLPVEVVQSVFTSFQPLHGFRKFSEFSSYDQNSAKAARFVLTEDWLNEGVPLTALTARECFGDWSSRNATAKNEWMVCGQAIDPRTIKTPAYIVVPGKDRIVPPQSARPLAQALPHAVSDEPMMGHIGIMASPAALDRVWTPLIGWLAAH